MYWEHCLHYECSESTRSLGINSSTSFPWRLFGQQHMSKATFTSKRATAHKLNTEYMEVKVQNLRQKLQQCVIRTKPRTWNSWKGNSRHRYSKTCSLSQWGIAIYRWQIARLSMYYFPQPSLRFEIWVTYYTISMRPYNLTSQKRSLVISHNLSHLYGS